MSGHSSECPKGRLHEKTSISDCGELCNVYMKELVLNLWIYHKFAAFSNISVHQFRLFRIHRVHSWATF